MEEKIVITMGRTYIDIDAYASCIAYRELLKLQGKENTIAVSNGMKNESITDTVLNLSFKLNNKKQWEQQDNVIIIDVSDPNYIDSMVVEKNVIEIIDHHTGFEQFWQEKLGEKAQIEFIGSCATIIFEKWKQAGYIEKMDKQIARLLCYAILDNTLNFKAKITNIRDKQAYTMLSNIGEIEDDFVEEYFRECQQKIEEDLEVGIKNDYKQVENGSYLPNVIGQLVVWERNETNTNISMFEQVLGKVNKQWMVNLICLQEGKSFLIANNTEAQEKLEKLFNKKFNGNVLELNLILRKEIIKKAQDKRKNTIEKRDSVATKELNSQAIKEIIEKQDMLIYYAKTYFEESLFIEKVSEEIDICYSALINEIIKYPQILDSLSTKNLMIVYSDTRKDNPEKLLIEERLMQRFTQGENLFAGSNIEIDTFGIVYYAYDTFFSEISRENRDEIANKIIEQLEQIKQKNPKCYNLLCKSNYLSTMSNFMEYYEKDVINEEKLEIIQKVISGNENLVKRMDFGLFQDDIISLGEEFVTHMARYPNLTAKLLMLRENNPELFHVFSQEVQENTKEALLSQQYDEIEYTLKYFTKNCYDIQVANGDRKELVNCAIGNVKRANDFGDKITMQWEKDYQKKLSQLCDEKYKNAETLEEKKNIYYNKVLSLSTKQVKYLKNAYGKNWDSVEKYTTDERIKKLFHQVKQIEEVVDVKSLDKLYHNAEIQLEEKDVLTLESEMKRCYALSYKMELQKMQGKVQELIDTDSKKVARVEYEGKKIPIIKVEGKFNVLIHSSDTGFKGDKEIIDGSFAKTWTKINDVSNHLIATSYINQDFLGCAPVGKNGVYYGFWNVPEEQLNLMGAKDINSHVRSSNYMSERQEYIAAEDMVYHSRRVYNEVDMERNNTKPDCIIVFDDTEKEVLENSYKAASEFNVPILYIDKRIIVKQQIEQLEMLQKQFEQERSFDKLKEIVTVYETNVAGLLLNRSEKEKDDTYTAAIDNTRFKKDFEEIGEKIVDSFTKYIEELEEKENGKETANQIIAVLKEQNQLYEDNEDRTPITKTEMKLDSFRLLEKVNGVIEQIDKKEYYMAIQLFVQTAIEQGITSKDILQVDQRRTHQIQREERG